MSDKFPLAVGFFSFLSVFAYLVGTCLFSGLPVIPCKTYVGVINSKGSLKKICIHPGDKVIYFK